MKIYIIPLILLLSSYSVIAQTKDSTITFNVLQSPSSPGAALLGISTSDVLKPSEPRAFAAQIQTATNSFATVPNSFAVDIAPKWFFAGRNLDYNKYSSNKLFDNLAQTFTISTAFKKDTTKNKNYSELAIGLKVSILRGKLGGNVEKYVGNSYEILNELSQLLNEGQKLFERNKVIIDSLRILSEQGKEDSEEFKQLKAESEKVQALLNVKSIKDLKDANVEVFKELKSLSEKLDYTRYGWKLDFIAGQVIDFQNNSFQNSKLSKTGIWFTGGYEHEFEDTKKSFSVLGIVRYLKDFDSRAEQNSNKFVENFDKGIRLLYTNTENKISFSSEIIHRGIINKSRANEYGIKPSLRFVVNGEYDVNEKTKLTLTLGKNYDSSFIKEGNVVGFINLLTSFGGEKRKIFSSSN